MIDLIPQSVWTILGYAFIVLKYLFCIGFIFFVARLYIDLYRKRNNRN